MKRETGDPMRHPSGLRTAWRKLWSPVLAAALAAGCFADIVVEEGGTGGGEPSDINALEPTCEPGDVNCNDRWLETCVEGGSDGPRWIKAQDCLSPTLCEKDPGRCVEPECRAGQPHCTGAIPDTCKGTLDGYDPLGECIDAAHCSPDEARCIADGKTSAPCCLTAPCDPGELRCNEGMLQRCRDDQTGFDDVVDCETVELCDATRGSCTPGSAECACQPPACDAGETRCTGSVLERCNDARTGWEVVQTCTTAALCELGRSRVPLACEPPACEPDEFDCNEATLGRCNADQTGFQTVMTCAGGPGFCNEVLGSCSQCQVGDTRCDGAQIQGCRADRSGFEPLPIEPCATPQLCVLNVAGAAECQEPRCGVGAFQCNGAQLTRCNDGRTAFEPFGQACPRADLCSAQRGRCDFCVPSRRECTPDLTASRTCAADGNSFGPLTPCPLGCIAETGACRTCTIGQYICAGGLLSRCDDGFSFTPLNRGADCSGSNRVSCAGNLLQTSVCGFGCNTTRNACNDCSASVPASCGPGLSCSAAGQCRCAPNALTCGGDALLLCNAAGTGTTAGARCSGAAQNVLSVCDSGVLSQDTCGSAALCQAAVGAECPLCTPGELACSAGALVQCSASGAAFEPAPACSGATLRSCTGTTVTTQPCGSEALCLASVGGVCAACLAADPPSCDDAGLEVTCVDGQRVTRECPGNQVCEPGAGCEPGGGGPPAE